MKKYEHIIVEKLDNTGWITFNRPDKYNSMIRSMALSIQRALDDFKEDGDVRAVVLTGKGKAFCAGQDLKEASGENPIDISRIIGEHFNPIIRKMREIHKPVIVAVNGVAAGAGASIALAGDLTIAAESASFIQAFVHIGLIPDSGSTFFLPRLVGAQRASALAMLGEKLIAKQAEEWGLIYKAVPDGDILRAARELSQKLAKLPTAAIGLMKEAMNTGWTNTLNQQLELEDQLQLIASKTDDFREGVDAFLEKRKPRFTGH